MNCREFADLVHQVAGRRAVDAALAAAARAHAEACPSCGERFAEARTLAGILHIASGESRRLDPPRHVEALLLEAFRREHFVADRRGPGAQMVWRPILAWTGGCAALALLVLESLVLFPGRLRPPASLRSPVSLPKATAPREVASSHPPSSSSKTNLTSDFVPVPFAGSSEPDDWGVIVRVRVPRSCLADLGYPVDEAQGGGVVQADLLVGGDGWPRAVRIVP